MLFEIVYYDAWWILINIWEDNAFGWPFMIKDDVSYENPVVIMPKSYSELLLLLSSLTIKYE